MTDVGASASPTIDRLSLEATSVSRLASKSRASLSPGLMLDDWTITYAQRRSDPALKTIWSGGGANVRASTTQVFEISYFGLADFLIEFDRRNIEIGSAPDCSPETERHFLYDDVFPRIVAHLGTLVLHAAAVLIDHSAVIFMGPSGTGKSSIAASLHNAGHRLLGDDAIAVSSALEGAAARAVYRSLRLYPDSLGALVAETAERTPVASYTDKRSVVFDNVGQPDAPLPIRALFQLGPHGDLVNLEPMSPAEACMACVEHSFWMDPTDLARAKQRMVKASELAARVPAFRLAYPRDYAALPAVRDSITAALG